MFSRRGTAIDSLFSSKGADQFVLRPGEGNDTIFDYEDNIDTLVLDGLSFEDLEIGQESGRTIIEIEETTEALVTISGIQTNNIDPSDFASS